MPMKYMNAFNFGSSVRVPTRVFVWANDPAEDLDFLAYLTESMLTGWSNYEVRNAVVDRSRAKPKVSWEVWTIPVGAPDWVLDKSGTIFPSIGDVWQGLNLDVSIFDAPGWWESDEYGRPFNLDDLLA